MQCLTIRDLLAAWNNLLKAEELAKQTEHLAMCPQCQELEKSLAQMQSLLPFAGSGRPLGRTPDCPDETVLIDYLGSRAGQISDLCAGPVSIDDSQSGLATQ